MGQVIQVKFGKQEVVQAPALVTSSSRAERKAADKREIWQTATIIMTLGLSLMIAGIGSFEYFQLEKGSALAMVCLTSIMLGGTLIVLLVDWVPQQLEKNRYL